MTRLAGLERQALVLGQIGQIGLSMFDTSDSPPLMMSGQCYAFDFARLAEDQRRPWHWTLMRAGLLGLAFQRHRRSVLAGYEIMGEMVRLFLCSSTDLTMKQSTHDAVAGVPGYIESGRDAVAVTRFRPTTFWKPPGTLLALWPLPRDSRSGPYAVDAGNLVDFSSYPESDHEQGLALDLAGPDYLRVPTTADGNLEPEGVTYKNRWADLVVPAGP